MYKKPITEITAVDTERMMDSMDVSINPGNIEHPQAGMPKRGEVIP